MFLRTLTASLLLSVLLAGTVSAAADPAANQASYWGNNCTKTEMNGEATFTPASGATKVIVKGGTGNQVYTSAPFVNLTAPINPNNNKPYGISHVIVCTDTVTAATRTTAQTIASTSAPKAGKGSDPTVNTSAPTTSASTAAAASAIGGAGTELTVPNELPAVGPAQIIPVLLAAAIASLFVYFAHSRYTAYRIA